MALLSMEKTHKVVDEICALSGFETRFDGPYIREAAIKTPVAAKEIIESLLDRHGILPGVDLGRFYTGMDNVLLLAATEKRTDEEIELLVKALKE